MLRDQIHEMIKRDIASFADPATEVSVSDRGATWVQMRKPIEVTFIRGEGELPDIRVAGRQFRYNEFFASEYMADIKALAEGIYHELARSEVYVDVLARQEDEAEAKPALLLLKNLASEGLPFGATRLVFVRGVAGAGKTFTLRHLSFRQAERFIEGASSFLFFYIDAQGRALSRLDEAIALLLQDLRARFTYHAVATLTRLGILVPIIDGFDELLGTGGYGEAFQSLARFMARLDGRGSVIASARSTFYEYRSFGQSASRYEELGALDFEIVPADFLPWEREQLEEYLSRTSAFENLGVDGASEGVERLYAAVGTKGAEFLKTPFFVSTIIGILRQGGSLNKAARIVPQLVEHFIRREMEKMKDRNGMPILDMQGHIFLLQSLAEEMWWQETRELDTDTVKTLAEIACEHLGIGYPNALTVIERVPAYAFLESKVREGRRHLTFHHEYYYSYFLGRLIAQMVEKRGDLSQLLSRSTLPATVGEEFGYVVEDSNVVLKSMLHFLGSRNVSPISREINRSNTGVLFAGIIHAKSGQLSGMSFQQADLVNSNLSATRLSECRFIGCELVHVDLVGADWHKVEFIDCRVSNPKFDMKARLTGTRLRIGSELQGLTIVKPNGSEESHFDPSVCASLCEKLGIVPVREEAVPQQEEEVSERAERAMATFRKFMRLAGRRFYISDDDLEKTGLLAAREWPSVLRLLKAYGLIKMVRIERRGPQGEVLRLAVPPIEFEQGEAGATNLKEVESFWTELRRL